MSARRKQPAELPPTQLEIDLLTWLAAGKRYKEIAELLQSNQYAVHQRMRRLMLKFRTKTACETIVYAMRRGIIS